MSFNLSLFQTSTESRGKRDWDGEGGEGKGLVMPNIIFLKRTKSQQQSMPIFEEKKYQSKARNQEPQKPNKKNISTTAWQWNAIINLNLTKIKTSIKFFTITTLLLMFSPFLLQQCFTH